MLIEAVQRTPDSVVHVAEPHSQAPLFNNTPSISAHGRKTWHGLAADNVQRKPVDVVHPTEPQRHVASLATVPSVLVQSGAAKQRQVKVEEHDAVEAVSVLTSRNFP